MNKAIFTLILACLLLAFSNQNTSAQELLNKPLVKKLNGIVKVDEIVKIDKSPPAIITNQAAFKAFCKKYKFEKQNVNFDTEFILVETYCCGKHTRGGNMMLKYITDKKARISAYTKNKDLCTTGKSPKTEGDRSEII